jgi:hypothetical protein
MRRFVSWVGSAAVAEGSSQRVPGLTPKPTSSAGGAKRRATRGRGTAPTDPYRIFGPRKKPGPAGGCVERAGGRGGGEVGAAGMVGTWACDVADLPVRLDLHMTAA